MRKKKRTLGRPTTQYPEIYEVLLKKKTRMNTYQIWEKLKDKCKKNKWNEDEKKPLCHKTIKKHLENLVIEGKVGRVDKNNDVLNKPTKNRERCYYIDLQYHKDCEKIRQLQAEYQESEIKRFKESFEFFFEIQQEFFKENPHLKKKWEQTRKKVQKRWDI